MSHNNFTNIHMGNLLRVEVNAKMIPSARICLFIPCSEEDLEKMYHQESIDSNILLRWSKLLEYDFFRIYSHHLLLYAPPSKIEKGTTRMPVFKKHLYTKEIIDFILEQIATKSKTVAEVITDYGIPKTTLYKWIAKYRTYDEQQP